MQRRYKYVKRHRQSVLGYHGSFFRKPWHLAPVSIMSHLALDKKVTAADGCKLQSHCSFSGSDKQDGVFRCGGQLRVCQVGQQLSAIWGS